LQNKTRIVSKRRLEGLFDDHDRSQEEQERSSKRREEAPIRMVIAEKGNVFLQKKREAMAAMAPGHVQETRRLEQESKKRKKQKRQASEQNKKR
jgi:hypothetical protein